VTSDQQLLAAINALLADNEEQIQLPLTAIALSAAQLSQQTSGAVTRLGNAITKHIALGIVDNANGLDFLSTAILQPLYDWQTENDLLLNHLAASAGLIQPGDPLVNALMDQAAQEPELAYSAIMAVAIHDLRDVARQIVEVLREMRDRMPGAPVAIPTEQQADQDEIDEPAPIDAEFDTPVSAGW
jgi:hypothetical protein